MIEKFVKKTTFESHQDFVDNYRIIVPENFNFAYDVVDEWARTHPDKRALCWTNDKGAHRDLTFGKLKTHFRQNSFLLSIAGNRKRRHGDAHPQKKYRVLAEYPGTA